MNSSGFRSIDHSVNGKIAVVTGAGQGVGRAVAQHLSASGHRVVLVGRTLSKLETVAAELPGEALPRAADLTDAGAVRGLFDTIEDTWGWTDILIANAGASMAAPLTATTDDEWQHMIESNLTSPFRCIRRALPSMIEQRWGRIVVIASVVAKRGERQVSAYSASKHGALGLVRAAADEVARSGVTVNAVCPGYVNTPMTDTTIAAMSERLNVSIEEATSLLTRRQPIGRLVEPPEVAAAVMACVDNGAINGQGLNVDGGAVQS